ncbi:MAG: YaiI/YqxD family protein [Methylococcales bacterium]
MKIWIDADACPVVVKEVLFKAAVRTHVQITLIANQYIRTPPSRYIDFIQVPSGFDAADHEIIKRLNKADLVITSDIPLAAEVIEKGADALNPRGELYTTDNIRAILTMRDFMDTLRSSGINTGGPSAISQNERQAFANQLDKWLVKRSRQNLSPNTNSKQPT